MLIAQISDIHAAPQSPGLDRLAEATDWLGSLRPDLLVVTGDLVDDGWQHGYRAIRDALRRLDCPVHVIPGNADCKETMRLELAEFCALGETMHCSRELGGMTLLGLDVTVAGAAHGDATSHVEWLENALRAAGSSTIIFMHQPPIKTGIAPLDAVMCRNLDALARVLAEAETDVLAILCGHVQRPISGRFGAIPVYVCGSLCEPNPLLLEGRVAPDITDAPSFAVCEIDGGELRHHTISLGNSS